MVGQEIESIEYLLCAYKCKRMPHSRHREAFLACPALACPALALTFGGLVGRFSNFFQKGFQNPMGLDPSSLTTSGSR